MYKVGYEKNAIFDQYFTLSRKRYKYGRSSYNGSRIGTRMLMLYVEWCHFQSA